MVKSMPSGLSANKVKDMSRPMSMTPIVIGNFMVQ